MYEELIRTLLSSLIPILITGFIGWIGSRNVQSKRKKIFEDAKQRMELINSYIESQTHVIDDAAELGVLKKTASDELYRIKAFLDNNMYDSEKSSEKEENYWQRFFLLYRMQTWISGLLRVGFYLILGLSVLVTLFLSSTSFEPSSIQEFGLWFNIIMVFIFSIPGILLAMVIRWLAIKFDKPTKALEEAD